MEPSPPRPDRALIVVLAVVAVIVVIALVVVFSRGAPKLLDASSPEGVVQRYSTAVIDGDEKKAAGYLVAATRDGCVRFDAPLTDNIRVTLVSTRVRADSADVRVSIAQSFDNGPFGTSESQFEDVFSLVKQGGDWLIETAPPILTVCSPAGTNK
ncbi:hypothetical protein [Lacisediminihabitans profunda]|uniref:Lipoprotein LpqB N-terminal domain-containing protein n=1 Tax=Lacisediminihabitans profunda TaxID=2594790 RepID=A0A5C8UNB0_9MICO|nr:hypothetical protein [Lacisediminihabitans profunda]TXN28767.1 hypothetical protein FVP33_16370 [Lacisediminihabitans profunda]